MGPVMTMEEGIVGHKILKSMYIYRNMFCIYIAHMYLQHLALEESLGTSTSNTPSSSSILLPTPFILSHTLSITLFSILFVS